MADRSILIDATHFRAAQPTGVERYVDALIPALVPELLRRGWRVGLVRHGGEAGPEGAETVRSAYIPGWGQLAVPRLLAGGWDAFFTPSGVLPLASAGRSAMTVHDVAVYTQPRSYPPLQRFRLRALSAAAARNAGALIAPSAYVAREAERVWHLPGGAVAAVPHGPLPLAEPQNPGGLPHTFALYVGRIERKKNLEVLAAACARAGLPLVLAGRDARDAPGLPGTVRLGYVDDGVKSWLLRHAAVLAVPGAGEGFGFGLLEGWEAGTPVVAAKAGALPEVAGGAALLVRPDDVEGWAAALREAEGAQRKRLTAAGKARLMAFSWTAAAAGTAEALDALG